MKYFSFVLSYFSFFQKKSEKMNGEGLNEKSCGIIFLLECRGKVMGLLVAWDFGPQVCACSEWRSLARKIYTSRGLPLSQGGNNPHKFSHTRPSLVYL